MKKFIKRLCLILLAMLPIASVSFAAQSALGSAQIMANNASDSASGESAIDSGLEGPNHPK
jgi:hypothetical protein